MFLANWLVWSSRCPLFGTLATFGSHYRSCPHPWTCMLLFAHVFATFGPRHRFVILLLSSSICVTASFTVNWWQITDHPFPVSSFSEEVSLCLCSVRLILRKGNKCDWQDAWNSEMKMSTNEQKQQQVNRSGVSYNIHSNEKQFRVNWQLNRWVWTCMS